MSITHTTTPPVPAASDTLPVQALCEQTYSTGELAKACGVSVRTVQYYDEKGLLPPAELTEGGRRVYTQADAAKLRKVLLLKSLGLKLDAIRGVLNSDVSAQVMLDILREQDAKLEREVADKQAARATISALISGLESTGELPAETIPDMEAIMRNEKWYKDELRGMYWTMIGAGLLVDIAEIGALAWWIATGDWRPFAAVMPLVVAATVILVRFYRKRVAYRCPHCHSVFVPKSSEWFFATHTPTTRKVTCTNCGEKDWCAEVSIEHVPQSAA